MGNIESARRDTFNWYSTADQVARDISLDGKVAIVTGANTGLGKETSRVLAKMGAHVIMACRSASRGQGAFDDIKRQLPNSKVTLLSLDLSSLKSIREFVSEFEKLNLPVHLLINNAGVMATPYTLTEDGFEIQFGTNHLGHFYLTNLLLPKLREGTKDGWVRVVNVSSLGHRMSDIDWNDLSGKAVSQWWTYSAVGRWVLYGRSKTANILFSSELNERMKAEGTKILSVALHPGTIHTELTRHLPGAGLAAYTASLRLQKSIPQGAATTIYCATAPEIERDNLGGKYFSDSSEAVPAAYARNPESARRLWEVSARLTGLTTDNTTQ